MIHNFKSFGSVLIAVVAVSAIAASAVEAKPVFTTAPSSPLAVHATSENVGEQITIDGVTVQCQVTHYTGTITNGTSTFELASSPTTCTLAGTGLTVHIKMNGCKYHFTLTQKDEKLKYTAHTKIVCPMATPIQIEGTGTSCEATIGSTGNSNLTTADFTNGPADIKLRWTLTGITANVTKDGFLCPFSSTGVKTGGTYTSTGDITITAVNGSVQISGE